jgi:hypothetical protein
VKKRKDKHGGAASSDGGGVRRDNEEQAIAKGWNGQRSGKVDRKGFAFALANAFFLMIPE